MKKGILLLLIITLFGCDQSEKVTAEEVEAVKEVDSRTGMVLETIEVDSYTYIRLEQEGREVWLASTPVAIPKGEIIRYSGEIVMKDFHSKNLNRTFPLILFVGAVQPVGADSETLSESLSSPTDVTKLHSNMATASAIDTGPVVVERLEGGKTIAEIFAEHEQIEGQEVSLRAKVIKFSPNILGKNWITLQDGTGAAPEDKLVVTSSETVSVGDVVIFVVHSPGRDLLKKIDLQSISRLLRVQAGMISLIERIFQKIYGF